MLKLILKNLWARRVRNAWLLAELILVTVLTWYITDPLFVLSYNQTLPLGYEPDGLLIAPIRSLPSTAPEYNKEEADSLHTMENMHRMLRKLRDYPGVQNAAPLVTFAFPGSGGSSYNTYAYDTLAIPDSLRLLVSKPLKERHWENWTIWIIREMILLYLLICCRSFRRSAG